jgi:tRNA/rRNA methyltransferase
MRGKINLDAVFIILVRPKFPENLGAVARAMKNMGLHRLRVVDGCSPLHPNALKLSSGAEDILERAEEIPAVEEALSDLGCVIGTTSREGRNRNPFLTPEDLAERLVPLSTANAIGLLFGSETYGLTNRELDFCHLFAKIPASPAFPSLNLAQAVMVIAYELFKASGTIPKEAVRVATAVDLEKMLSHMQKTLTEIGFLEKKSPKKMMRLLRRVLGRTHLTDREVRIFQGIWSQVDWVAGRKKKKF